MVGSANGFFFLKAFSIVITGALFTIYEPISSFKKCVPSQKFLGYGGNHMCFS